MKSIAASKFKEQCLSILENVDSEGLLITKHGQPVARLTPVDSSSRHLIGKLKGRIKRRGKQNLFSTGLRWNAES